MRQKKFALQPLLEQCTQREGVRRGELARAHRACDASVEGFADMERRCDAAGQALVRSASQGRVLEAQTYDAMLRNAGSLRLRYGAEMAAHDAAIASAAAALTIVNRERRTLERLRDRLAARRARRTDDD